ncbi:MAG: transposase [Oligoflexia bacterium]|nr:transposase [Oligoflexia bacterium]
MESNTKDKSNTFIEIFKNHWSEFKAEDRGKAYDTEWYNSIVEKMINCGDPTPKTKKLIADLWKEYGKKGFVFNIDKKDVPRRSEELAKYLSKYLFRPAISVKRIIEYDKDKKRVIYEYACHETGKIERTNVSVFEFIGRMVQ